jgi:hypothetical protein
MELAASSLVWLCLFLEASLAQEHLHSPLLEEEYSKYTD